MKQHILLNKETYKKLFYFTALAVFILAVIPNDHMSWKFDYADKVKHFTAFFILSFLLNRASSTMTHRLRNMVALLLFGIFIEIVQMYVIYRSSSIYDIYADIGGILLFQGLFSLYKFFNERDVKQENAS
jgi:VanZ family protein